VHFGTDAKSAHVGYAAQRGLHAALLAREGFTAAPGGILGRRGLLEVVGPDGPHNELDRDLGAAWRLLDNRLKPYASGVVTHPAIDLARLVREWLGADAGRIAGIDLRVHPLVGELTGIQDPQTGLEGKFSVRHCFAAGFLRDRAGPAEFTDTFVLSPEVQRLRERVSVRVQAGVRHMTAAALVEATDGSSRTFEVLDARGSDPRPMTDAEVDAKFVDLVAHRTGPGLAAAWFARLSRLDRAPDVAAELAELDAALGSSAASPAARDERG
jgi:2-methylcitrate dehydratase PrpD